MIGVAASDHDATPDRCRTSETVLVLWDATEEPPENDDVVYRWSGYAEGGSVHSLLGFVEANAGTLREKYLAWIHDLGETRIGRKRLIDHLAFSDGLSYWWLTLFVEKSPFKSPVSDAIRLMAWEEILARRQPARVRLVSANRVLHRVVRALCAELAIAYEWRRPAIRFGEASTLRRIFRRLPPTVQAMLSLARHVRTSRPRLRTPAKEWFGGDRALFFCSYFDNVDLVAAADGRFLSHYWDGLPALWQRLGGQTNWLQIFVATSATPDEQVAEAWVGRFNGARLEQGFHALVNEYLTWPMVGRVLARWLRLSWTSLRLYRVREAFRPAGARLSLWPLLERDWRDTMRGQNAITNLLWIELFDAALRDVPHQKKGLFLCENQGWERALAHAWRKHRHGVLFGVGHVPVKFWDLRHYSDPRSMESRAPHSMPRPDFTVLNGAPAVQAYRDARQPMDEIIECEALRFGYLNDQQSDSQTCRTSGERRVLVLGDVAASATARMMALVTAAAVTCPARFSYTAKPHPNCPVRPDDYPSLGLEVETAPLGQIVRRYDVAFASGSTSAAVDAYLSGVPVVVMLDDAELNLSPLRGQPGVRFVSTPAELAEALQATAYVSGSRPNSADFFNLGRELPAWRRLLAN
jgi:surface carbohydrate biosynthesis protein (TIGR04326 family)